MGGHWTAVDEAAGIHTTPYTANDNPITCSAVRIQGGRFLILSPAIDPPSALFDELDALGGPGAIVSSGPFHHLGMPAWRARYPDVPQFATTSGLDRIPKQHKGVDLGLQGIEALQPLLSQNVVVKETPGMKHADAFVTVTSPDGTVTGAVSRRRLRRPRSGRAAQGGARPGALSGAQLAPKAPDRRGSPAPNRRSPARPTRCTPPKKSARSGKTTGLPKRGGSCSSQPGGRWAFSARRMPPS